MAEAARAEDLPPRYEPLLCLGSGGGGEVWSVRDRVSRRALALKVLSRDAGEAEIDALVREAIALSGLEGLGVPRVHAFGALKDGRRYMVRELVEGRSLDEILQDASGGPWIPALVSACDELTVVHRSGFLHGDVKPANIIVGIHGRGTLVDLGLAAPWREGGTTPRGLSPKYAAPEIFLGEPYTVRAEVYALGATLSEALAQRGDELPDDVRIALAKVAARAVEEAASLRWPSVDEFASALRRGAGVDPKQTTGEPPWPVLGLEVTAQELALRTKALPSGGTLVLQGPPGSGRTTLARRLAWALGVSGRPVALIDSPGSIEIELAHESGIEALTVIADDADALHETARAALKRAMKAGARLVWIGHKAPPGKAASTFEVPPLDEPVAAELVQRSVPSLPDALRSYVIARVGNRPGPLRAAVRRLAGRVLVSQDDVDAALESRLSVEPPRSGRRQRIEAAEKAIEMGRFDEAADALNGLDGLDDPRNEEERVRSGIAHARIALGRGDTPRAVSELAAIESPAVGSTARRAWQTVRARAHLRAGEYAQAVELTQPVIDSEGSDALAADALSIRGVAFAFTGEDIRARAALEQAVDVARATGESRIEAVALGSAAIAHQRAGRTNAARSAYEGSLASAHDAGDAATVAAMRLNLAGIAQAEGDLAQALVHLEAAVDMGRRAGGGLAVTQALLNLANLDLFLGRWARARGSIDQLASMGDPLSPAARTQLLGLEAEHAARTGDVTRGARLYEETARAWEAQGRMHDAAESRLEGLLVRTRAAGEDPRVLARELSAICDGLGPAGLGEHSALAELVRGVIAHAAGDEDTGRRALDSAIEQASKGGRKEWAWQALDARARLAATQGSVATARRDTESALALLEETAAKLPGDLREVFWDDPRRHALRQAHTATAAVVAHGVWRPGAGPAVTTASAGGTSMFTGRRLAEDRLARILEITRELASEYDVPRLLQRVTDHAVALLGAERGLVVLLDEKGELEAQASRLRSGQEEPHTRFSRSVADRVVESGEAIVTMSARDDERLAAAASVHQLMIQSIACVPIRGTPPLGRTIGALYVETRVRPGVRFEQELPVLEAFADQAAIAIENARLIAENRERADELARANTHLAAARDELARLLGKRTEQLADARRDLKQVRAELRSRFGYAGLVGMSTVMRRLYALINRVKDTDVPVLVTGESGTGKEMVARAVHNAGPRAKKPMLGVNCGAIPANLLESELFGSIRGSFTGAERDRRGLFREAEGGTLLLDEIGEMPQKMQTGLLRVLQEKTVRPIGGTLEEPVDVRVIAATNRDLSQMVADGEFREDLYYRLHVVVLHVPPLRDRVEDIPPLIDHFLSIFTARYRRERKALSRDALRKLCAYRWPGNVRQLEHVLLNAWLMSDGNEIPAEDVELPAPLPASNRATPSSDPRGRSSPPPAPAGGGHAASETAFKAAERERILSALTTCNWNRVAAAKMLGLPRRTFYRRLKEFGIL